MSLYADDDLDPTLSSLELTLPTSSSSHSSLFPPFQAPADPMAALTLALPLPPDSQQQADALTAVGERFEERPEKLPDLCALLLPMVTDGGESLLRSWTLEMVALTVGRSALKGDIKLKVAQQSLQSLDKLVHSSSIPTLRAVIPIFSTVYPLLFRVLATSSPPPGLYEVFNSSKARILSLALDPNAQPQSVGVKAAAWKFVQKVLLVGTRAAGGDPRLANRGDVSVSMIGQGSPLNPSQLEDEAQLLRTQLVTLLYSSSSPALLHPIINTFPVLCKSRPTIAPLLVSSMASWTPATLEAARSPAMQIRAVEKTLRAVMSHLARHPPLVAYSAQLNDALIRQKQRMELAYANDQEERRQRQQAAASITAVTPAHEGMATAGPGGGVGLKHELESGNESSGDPTKRARMTGPEDLEKRMIDVSTLPVASVIEAVMNGLNSISVEVMARAFEDAKRAILDSAPDSVPVLASSLGVAEPLVKDEEDEFENPLDMELDDDEDLLLSPDDADQNEEAIVIADFRLPPPEPIDESEKIQLVHSAVQRIWDSGADLEASMAGMKLGSDVDKGHAMVNPGSGGGMGVKKEVSSDAPGKAVGPSEMWMLLLARMAARSRDGKRDLLGEFVVKDFANRSKFATVWLNEEWLAKRRGDTNNHYAAGLSSIISACITSPSDSSITNPTNPTSSLSLSSFLLGLPEIPSSAISALEPLCEDTERMLSAFLALRDLAESRPPVRARALETLLEMCSHGDRKVRVMAITTVRRWVPGSAMAPKIMEYALGMLRRLATGGESVTVKVEEIKGDEGDRMEQDKKVQEKMSDQQSGEINVAVDEISSAHGTSTSLPPLPHFEPIHSRFLGPITPETVQQHVELLFALSRRSHDLLDSIFTLYPYFSTSIQSTFESLLTPLIQSLGANKKLVEILKRFPEGSDQLVMRVMSIMSAAGNGGVVANVVKGLMSQRELDPRFIIPIIGELDRTEIEKQIPNIVKLLGTADSARDTVRTAFASALQKMTPADLLVCLHREDGEGKQPEIKQTIDAIEICFSMTTVFRSDVLATAIQRIVDLPTPLPVCVIRTILLTLKYYKASLVPFIANNVLPKLIARKIWESSSIDNTTGATTEGGNGEEVVSGAGSKGNQLWDGFIRLVRVLGQASYGALLQMPVERIREVVEKQPALRGSLKNFLASKPGARDTIIKIFGEE